LRRSAAQGCAAAKFLRIVDLQSRLSVRPHPSHHAIGQGVALKAIWSALSRCERGVPCAACAGAAGSLCCASPRAGLSRLP